MVVIWLVTGVVTRLAGYSLGIHDRGFTWETQLPMWLEDSEMGFLHLPNYEGYACGYLRVVTDQHGFRGTPAPPLEKPPDTQRVLMIGDSVTWGFMVEHRDSFAGQLGRLLAEEPGRFEVINAGVIGFSTLQEQRLLQRLLRFSPDVVMVNLCANDALPSEDHFKNLRGIYADYLLQLVPRPEWNDPEREQLQRLAETIRHRKKSIHGLFRKLPPEFRGLVLRACVEVPVREMKRACDERGIRLIYLMIPGPEELPEFTELRTLVEGCGVETVDFAPLLGGSEPNYTRGQGRFPYGPVLDLANILIFRERERFHQTHDYMDNMHPSRRGNRVIAEHLHRLLAQGPESKKPEAGRPRAH